jgi:hypothetical protein
MYEEDSKAYVECDAGLYYIDWYTKEFADAMKEADFERDNIAFSQAVPGGPCTFAYKSDAENIE